MKKCEVQQHILHSLKTPPHNMLINYKGKEASFTAEKTEIAQ